MYTCMYMHAPIFKYVHCTSSKKSHILYGTDLSCVRLMKAMLSIICRYRQCGMQISTHIHTYMYVYTHTCIIRTYIRTETCNFGDLLFSFCKHCMC